MPIAAVPSYLPAKDFAQASPGLRFGLFLPIWTTRRDQEAIVKKRAATKSREGQEINALLQRDGMDAAIRELSQRQRNRLPGLWEKNDDAAREAWRNIRALNADDTARMKALLARQDAAYAARAGQGSAVRLVAVATAPFTTGLGNEHPLENGFAFLWPYGLPYLPGSGVKGVLRQAARELAQGKWGDTRGWRADAIYPLMRQVSNEKFEAIKDERGQPIRLSMLDVLFGRETESGDKTHVRGALAFWDVIPQVEGKELLVEIMTPHQSHYYQQKKDRKTGDSVSPHDSGQPTPIPFLTVPPGSRFTFHVVCDTVHLARLNASRKEDAADLLEVVDGKPRWQVLLEAAFEHAFAWLGFGAKTAVGYGAMMRTSDLEVKEQGAKPREVMWDDAVLKWDAGGGGRITAIGPGGLHTVLSGKET